jgi:uncharacterized protein
LTSEAPLAVVVDEVAYLAEVNSAFASILQAAWDRHTVRPQRREPLVLILTGSAIGVVRSLLDAGGPLFRRASWEHRLDPLRLPAVTGFFPDSPADRVVEAYAACGGFPLYLQAWDVDRRTEENLLRLAATPGAILLEDAPSVVRDEIGDVTGFARVLTAIGLGRTRAVLDPGGRRSADRARALDARAVRPHPPDVAAAGAAEGPTALRGR